MNNKDHSYRHPLQAIDGKIEQLLDNWAPTIGTPTCKDGCSNCCRGEIVASTAEVRQLLDFIADQSMEFANDFSKKTDDHIERLKKSFSEVAEAASRTAEQKINLIGVCPFLNNRSCSIYEGRPYACRAMHSWKDSKNCGKATDNAGTPLGLYEARSHYFSEAMKQEAREGRYPFFGQLSIVVYYLLKFRDSYEEGVEFSNIIDPFWKDVGMLWFPYQNQDNTLQQIVINIEHQQEHQRKAFNHARALARLPD